MEYVDLSDLEEGEILEYESGSPSDSKCKDFEIKECSFHSPRKEYKSCSFSYKGNQDREIFLCEKGGNGYPKKSLSNKWEFSTMRDMKSNMGMVDLESISLDSEPKSDEENKYSNGNKNYVVYSESRNGRKKKSTQFYGAVKDIMSEIGETICRRTHCNYKKRKSKESQHISNKYSDKSYDLWSHNIFSSHLKSRKRKRYISFSDSDSDSAKDRMGKREKKKRKREFSYEEDKKSKKTSQERDFDEMRKTLLEKLKKQKAEEELKANECLPEMESSDIQEVDMLTDCTNYVDNPRSGVAEDLSGDGEIEDNEDELDLIKLRLIALASNKKQRCGETASSSIKSEELSEMKKSDNSNEELDLDKSELLLRAEALKTALLKKHQKRLSRLKLKKSESVKNKDVNGTMESINSMLSEGADADAYKENMEREIEGKNVGNSSHGMSSEVNINNKNEAPSESTGCLKKTHTKARTKRKKKRSGSFANSLKENTDKSEAFEEDDRTLRSQLLRDLMEKKSLKDVEEKSVLLESIQTSNNMPSPSLVTSTPPKDNCKQLAGGKKTTLRKVNPPKTMKPILGVAIPKAEIQRIIVHLGSDDSSEEDNSFCRAPSGIGRGKILNEENNSKEDTGVNFTHADKAVHADYERSVELLLSQARKKIEGEKRPIEESSALATPEAVYKHLPPSQRLEYMRLKQKIAERERLRKEKMANSNVIDLKALKTTMKETPIGISQESKSKTENIVNGAPESVISSPNNSEHSLSKSVVVLHSPSSKKATGRGITNFNFNGLKSKESSRRRVLNKTKNNWEGVHRKELPPDKGVKSAVLIQRNKLLLPSSQALISKLKVLLKKIKIEKIIEENYEKEIVKLKNQISVLEKKKNEQRFKIKKLGEESMNTYKAIQDITKSNEKSLPKENGGAEKKIDGDSESKVKEKRPQEKEEIEGKNVSNEPEMELSKAQNKTDKRLNNQDKTSEIANETSADICLLEYQSPLETFSKVSVCSSRVDPNVMMCPFDLTGVCKDEECTYQHLRAS